MDTPTRGRCYIHNNSTSATIVFPHVFYTKQGPSDHSCLYMYHNNNFRWMAKIMIPYWTGLVITMQRNTSTCMNWHSLLNHSACLSYHNMWVDCECKPLAASIYEVQYEMFKSYQINCQHSFPVSFICNTCIIYHNIKLSKMIHSLLKQSCKYISHMLAL